MFSFIALMGVAAPLSDMGGGISGSGGGGGGGIL